MHQKLCTSVSFCSSWLQIAVLHICILLHINNFFHARNPAEFLLFVWKADLCIYIYIYIYKITADGDCSHEIKRRLLLGRKAVTNLDSILQRRDITWPTKVHLVKAMIFPVVMYGCESDYEESWVPKNWCFWTEVLEKTLESPASQS